VSFEPGNDSETCVIYTCRHAAPTHPLESFTTLTTLTSAGGPGEWSC